MAKVRKRGKYWQIDYFDPNGKRVRKSFKKKKVAVGELGKRVALITEGRYLDVKKECTTTFGQLMEKYEENFKHQSSWKTCKKYIVDELKNHFGERTIIANIRYMDLETYRNALMQTPTKHGNIRSVASVNRAIACLRHAFTKAVEWEMIETSPFSKGRTLIQKENNTRLRFLSQKEIPALLETCPDYLKDIVECAINTGMRKDEILSLRWNQIRSGLIYLTKTKSNKARQIPVNDVMKALFASIRRRWGLMNEYVFLWDGAAVTEIKGKVKVCRPKKAKAIPVRDVKMAFKKALKRACIEDFRFHDLRHTFASHFVMRGGSIKDLQELLGHKSLAMTMRYAHLTQEHKKKAVNLLNGLTASKPSCHKSGTIENPPNCASL